MGRYLRGRYFHVLPSGFSLQTHTYTHTHTHTPLPQPQTPRKYNHFYFSDSCFLLCPENTSSTLTFATMSGELKARRAEDGIVLDFPLYPAFPQDLHEVEDLIKAAIGDTLVQDIRYSPDTKNLMVRLSDSYDRSFLETLRVNTEPLPQMEKTGKVKGLILTLRGKPGGQTPYYDFYSRYFAPWVGVAEDPVTGSTHTILGPYWSEELGKKEMRAFQCSRRGGELDISLRPDGRVDLKGGAAVVLEGTLTV